MNARQFFHLLSYLQYPLILIGLYFGLHPYWNGFQVDLEKINHMLVFMGLSVSFSTLQDTAKTQNKLSRKIWEHPVKGKAFLIMLLLTVLVCFGFGSVGYFYAQESALKELAAGLFVLGIGLIGMLKAAIDMFEHHRKDKN